jgi:hypothetical protein
MQFSQNHTCICHHGRWRFRHMSSCNHTSFSSKSIKLYIKDHVALNKLVSHPISASSPSGNCLNAIPTDTISNATASIQRLLPFTRANCIASRSSTKLVCPLEVAIIHSRNNLFTPLDHTSCFVIHSLCQ